MDYYNVTGGKRIALNTTISYMRTIIGVIIVLFSSRWALQSLGVIDFGLYNLIGTILFIVVFLNTVLSNGDARFFSIAIGKGNQLEINKIFNTSLSLHLVMPLIIVLVGLFVGEPIIRYLLVVPTERLEATIWAFRITMLTSFFTMASIPFSTLFIAYQNILEYSIITFIQTTLIFFSAYSLRFFQGDKLIVYTILVSLSYIITNTLQIYCSLRKYKNIKIKKEYFFTSKYCKSIIKYSFWNMLGDFGHLIRTQGISVIVNLYFGPQGNAALGIANQVAMQACNLTNSMSTAFSPELYRRVGEKQFESAKKLAGYSTKAGLFLMFILCIPIVYNIDDMLRIWLGVVPKGTSSLCLCFIVMFILEKATLGQHALLRALNKIALVNAFIMLSYCMTVVFPFFGLLNWGVLGIGISCLLSMFLSRLFILYCVKKYTEFSLSIYIKDVIFPLLYTFLLSIMGLYFYENVIINSLLDLILYSGALFSISVCLVFYLIFNKNERGELKKIFLKKFN